MKKDKKRFEKIYSDPKFKPIPKKVQKVELKDNRFEAMFKNKDFVSSTGIDEYGRKIESKKGNINMENYYIQKNNNNKKKNKKKEEITENNLSENESDTSEEFEEFLLEMQKQNAEMLKADEEEQNIPTG